MVMVVVSMSLAVALLGAGLAMRDEIKRRSSIGRRPVARGPLRQAIERGTGEGEQRDQTEEEQLRGGQTRLTNDSRISDASEPCGERVQIAADRVQRERRSGPIPHERGDGKHGSRITMA